MQDRIARQNYDRECRKHYTIAGGKPAKIVEFPHMAALGWKALDDTWVYLCGGSLISHKFVLTAAHCTKHKPIRIKTSTPQIVRLGATNVYGPDVKFNELPVIKEIKHIIPHPYYKSPKKYFDIALLELKENVMFTKLVHPACLMVSSDIIQTQLTATGWGALGEKKNSSVDLQSTVLDVFNFEQCSNTLSYSYHRNWLRMRKHQMCAGKMDGSTDTCPGDSGAPLQYNLTEPNFDGNMHVIVGITSFGLGCARKDTPGIYTKISYFIDWIEAIVWPNYTCINTNNIDGYNLTQMIFFPCN
ncbi:unnamed protein product, partial [Brenthis ino]